MDVGRVFRVPGLSGLHCGLPGPGPGPGPVRDEHSEPVSGGRTGDGGAQRSTCELVFVSLLPGLVPRSKVRLAGRGRC